MNGLMGRFVDRLVDRRDRLEKKAAYEMRDRGKLFFLSELIPAFKGSAVYTFGTGGSVANLQQPERLRDYNLFTVTTGPLYYFRKYGTVPNIWVIHNPDSVDMFLAGDSKTPVDFTDSFIMVPANDSNSKLHFSSPVIKKLRERHPEASFVLYREIFTQITDFNIPKNHMEVGIEPLRAHHGSVLEALFLPLCSFLGVKTLFFSGIDQLPTGHFWDRDFQYQDISGRSLSFPEHENTIKINNILMELAETKGMKVFRLEEKETILQMYPHASFNDTLKTATRRIVPSMLI